MADEKLPLIPPDQQERIITAIDALAKGPCPRCGTRKFALIDGYPALSLSREPAAVSIGGRIVPCVATACLMCGLVNLHALGVLGLNKSEPPAEGK